jgi:hypothetical protein
MLRQHLPNFLALVWFRDGDAFDGAQLTREIILLCSPTTAPEKKLMVLVRDE